MKMKTKDQALDDFLNDYALKYSPRTINLYKYTIQWFLDFCPLPLEDLNASNITDWVLTLRAKGLSPSTQGSYLRGVKMFFHYLKQENLLCDDPTEKVPYPGIPQRMPNYLTHGDYLRLVKLTEGQPFKRALLELLYCTGLRAHEVVNIRLGQINWQERQIHITIAKGNDERMVFFTARCAELLKEYLATRNDENPYLLINTKGRPLSVNLLEHYFRELSKAFGKRVTPHTLRHTFAVVLVLKGVSVRMIQILMGHEEIKHTLYYTELVDPDKKELYARVI